MNVTKHTKDAIKGASQNVFSLSNKIQGITIGCLSISFILLNIFNDIRLEYIISVLLILVIIGLLPSIRGITLYISIFLLFTGLLLILYHRAPPQIWLSSWRINLPLVAIFIVVPLLGIPVKIGGYVDALKTVFSKKMNNPYFFYLGINFITHLLSVVINIGSISIVSELTKASNIKTPRIIANIINRGYIMSIFWSPYFSSMALILAFLPIKWSSLAGYAIGLVVLSIIISFLLDRKILKEIPKQENDVLTYFKDEEFIKAKRKLIELSIYIVLITVVVLSLEYIAKVSMVLIVSLVALSFPVVWCLVFGNIKHFVKELKNHLFIGLPRMKKEITLFLIAGFFSGAFIYADLGNSLVTLIQFLFGDFYLGAAYFIAFLIFTAALTGIHPIVVITVFVTSVNPELIGLSPEYFALLLLGSFGVSNTISPSTAVNNLLANLLNEKILDVSLYWNLKFCIIMLVLIPIYLSLVNL